MGNLRSIVGGELIEFFEVVNSLKKNSKREGTRNGTTRYSSYPDLVHDSSSEHSHRAALMGWMIAEQLGLDIDTYHAVKMLLVHDLPEYFDDDVDAARVALGKVSKKDKEEGERRAATKIRDNFPFGGIIYDLWEEFEEWKTPEARYAKGIDGIESVSHMAERGCVRISEENSERIDRTLDMTATYCDKAIQKFPALDPIWGAVKVRLREVYERQGFIWKPKYDLVGKVSEKATRLF